MTAPDDHAAAEPEMSDTDGRDARSDSDTDGGAATAHTAGAPAPEGDPRRARDGRVGPTGEAESPSASAAPAEATAGTTAAAIEKRTPHELLDPGARPPPSLPRTGVFVDEPSLRAHVGDLLRVLLGHYEVDAWGSFTFPFRGARIFVTVGMSPTGPQVGVFSVTNLDLPLSPELAEFLVTANHRIGYGAFAYDRDNQAVWLRHMLVGATLDAPELHTVVGAIATTAAEAGDAVRARFGGRRFDDAPTAVQEATRPTPPSASGYL